MKSREHEKGWPVKTIFIACEKKRIKIAEEICEKKIIKIAEDFLYLGMAYFIDFKFNEAWQAYNDALQMKPDLEKAVKARDNMLKIFGDKIKTGI